MKFTSLLFFVVFCLSGNVLAQHLGENSLNQGSRISVNNRIAHLNFLSDNKSNWDVQLKSFAASVNPSNISEEELEVLKMQTTPIVQSKISNRDSIPAPQMMTNFEGNRGTGGVPPDNTMAISTNGYIISSINSNLLFAKADGIITTRIPLADFFIDLGLGAGFFDPRVIFDIEERKFIIVALSGSQPATSTVVIAFSETEDPAMGWNFYKLPGDMLGEKVWFDYPNIAITDHELFISGNMFSEENQFRYSSIYQVSKMEGYQGLAIKSKHYTKLKEPNSGQNLFNLTPCSRAWNKNEDEKLKFITNVNRGESDLFGLFEITGNLNSNPAFNPINFARGESYFVSPSSPQKGTTNVLQTGDCRIQYAIIINDVIHFVFKARVDDKAGFCYGRYDISTNKVFNSFYSEADMFVSYPSIAAFGDNENESKVIINFLRGNKDLFPEQAAVVCEGNGNQFIYSPSILLKTGETFVNALDSDNERWGDYSTIVRRFFGASPETWASGCFGRTRFGSWLAQLMPKNSNIYDFFASNSVINPGDTTRLYSVSSDSIVAEHWTVNGGTVLPEFDSTGMVRFDSLGVYSASLKLITQSGDSIEVHKDHLIFVVPQVFAPMAQFEADKQEISEGDTIQLKDLSTNNPTKWKWTLSGGNPAKSEEQNPRVTYAKKGNYNIILLAKNSAGEDAEIKQKYITVKQLVLAPVAAFGVDKNIVAVGDSVMLQDLSTNGPSSWQWRVFNEDRSDTFMVQHPIVHMTQAGSYNVSLIVNNEAGADTTTKTDYIIVETSSTEDENWFDATILFPNPVVDDKFTLMFNLDQPLNLNFEIYSLDGKKIKSLLSKNVKQGRNEFSFNTSMLSSSSYILRVVDVDNFRVTSFNFIKP